MSRREPIHRRKARTSQSLAVALVIGPALMASSLAHAANGTGTVSVDSGVGALNAIVPPAPGGLGSCVPASAGPIGLGGGAPAGAPLSQYLQPSLSVGEMYSDNIALAPPGHARSDSATVVTPALSGCRVGSRLLTHFRYTGQYIHYARSEPHNKVYSQFDGTLKADLYANHLFLDASTNYGQSVINPASAFSVNNVFITTSNRANVWTSSVSPYWRQGLGALGLATLRYTYGRVVYTNQSLDGSRTWGTSFDLVSPSSNIDWSWHAHWHTSRVKTDYTGTTTYFDTASLQVGYQLFYNLRLLATGGVEDNYKADGTLDRYGSHFWNAGFSWANTYSSLKVLYGHRFFGRSLDVNATYNARALRLGMSYTETATVNALQQTSAVTQPTTTGPVTPLNQLQVNETYIDKRWGANATYLMARSQLNVGLFDERKDYRPTSLGHDRTSGGNIGWAWQATARTTVNASFNRERLLYASASNQADFMNTSSLGVSYALLTNTKLTFSVGRQTRRSHTEANNYTANSALLALSATF